MHVTTGLIATFAIGLVSMGVCCLFIRVSEKI